MTFLEKRNKLLERNKDKIISQKVKVLADNVEAENFAHWTEKERLWYQK